MHTVILVIHLIITVALIGVIMLQRSEGGALGIGGGGGGNLFSARGVGNALTRATAFLAIGFFITSITLTLMVTRSQPAGSLFDQAPAQGAAPAAPAGDAPAAPSGSVLPNLPAAPPAGVPAAPAAPATPAAPAAPTN